MSYSLIENKICIYEFFFLVSAMKGDQIIKVRILKV